MVINSPKTLKSGRIKKREIKSLRKMYFYKLSSWSDEEQLKLIEGIRLYGKDWESISDHVGTKTKIQVY